MKAFRILLPIVAVALILGLSTGCKKTKKGNLILQIQPKFGNQNFALNSNYQMQGKYVNFQLLEFYLSHISLVANNGSTIDVSDAALMDLSATSTLSVSINNVDAQDFKGLNLSSGLDSVQNNNNAENYAYGTPFSGFSTATSTYSMFWGMTNGQYYRFQSMEGGWIDSTQQTISNPLVYHTGYDVCYHSVQLSHTFSISADNTTTLVLNLYIDQIFSNSQNPINIITEPKTIISPTDPVSLAFASDFSQAFSFN
jgi:hypothetical protein